METFELLPIEDGDLALFESMFCDPDHMKELGGPQPKERVPQTLQKQKASHESGKGWVFKLVVTSPPISIEGQDVDGKLEAPTSFAAGTVCLWESEWKDEPVSEMGWGIAPAYKRHGYGTKAVQLLIEKARTESAGGGKRWGVIHAFTSTTNEPSNKICERSGFRFEGVVDVDYDGHNMHSNHWTVDTTVLG